MTILQPAPTGASSGQTVSAVNSGFATVVTSGGHTVTYDSSIVRSGTSLSFLYTFAGASGVAYGAYSTLNGTQWRMRLYVYLTALPNAEWYLGWLSSATTVQASIGLLATGKLVQRASGTAGTGNSGSVTIPLNTWVRIEYSGTVGSTGTMQSAMYSGESTTALDSLSTTGQNTGTANLVNARFGLSTTTTASGSMRMSGMAVGDDSTTFFGPAAAPANNPPTITGPAPFNTTNSTANLTFQGNDTDGTISSFACVHLSNTAVGTVTPTVGTGVVTNPGTANASVTFPVSGMTANAQYRFGATDTDNSGATSSQVVALVNVTSPTPAIRPDTTTTGYTIVGGGTVQQALAAGSPSTRYLQSAAPAAGSTGSIPVEPLPASAVPVFFSVTGHASDSSTPLTRTVQLWQGATKIAETSGTINPTTDTTIGRNTKTSETAAITDRAALTVKWVVS